MFAAATTQRLVHEATDAGNPRRLDAISELGRQEMSEEIIGGLAAVVRQSRHQPSGTAVAAAKVLAQSNHPRISTVLAELLDHEANSDLQHFLVMTLAHPRHSAAIAPIIAAASRELAATGHCHWLEGLLGAIGTPQAKSAWDEYRAASVDSILQAALARLKLSVIPEVAEQDLADIGTPAADRALAALRQEMIRPLLHIAKTSDNYDNVGRAITKLKTLKILSVPGSAEAMQDFLSQPARKLIRWIPRQEHVESGALESWTDRVERSSSDFGQRP